MEKKDKVLEFLKLERFCVLATADKNSKPEAAMVCFFVKNDLSILLYTDPRTRKAENLKENRQASLVICNLEKQVEVQTDGKTTILEGDEAQKAKEYILSVEPEQESHMKKRPVIFIHFKPGWIRFCNFGVEPDEIFEFKP